MAEEQNPISFFEKIKDIHSLLAGKEPLIFLDYDGTLTPIVDTPDLAVLAADMKDAVIHLAQKHKVSIVSGRATDDVKNKVDIDGIFYAGSHGFEIVCPDGHVEVNKQAQEIQKTIDCVHQELSKELKGVKGALVEHVKYTISTHYRLVDKADFSKIKIAVERVVAENDNLRLTHGKKVFEIRPDIDWHKGKAVNWILEVLKFDPAKHVPLYIGDDTTDEDAFDVLAKKGFGILVADPARKTKAKYWIKDTEEVKRVLEYFIKR